MGPGFSFDHQHNFVDEGDGNTFHLSLCLVMFGVSNAVQ